MKSTSYNLVMSALYNGKKGSRPPAAESPSIVCHDLMDASGVSFRRPISMPMRWLNLHWRDMR